MKKIIVLMGLMTALILGVSWAWEVDVKPTCCGEDWQSYVQADKDSKAAGKAKDYKTQAEKTPFSWVKAWACFNMGRVDAGHNDFDSAEAHFLDAEAFMETAVKNGVCPKVGPNSEKQLAKVIASYRKWITDVKKNGSEVPKE